MSEVQPQSSTAMDLATLLEQVPHLLRACIDSNPDSCHSTRRHLDNDAIYNVRTMRLVNKECSRVALLGLRSYTLTLGGRVGSDRETNVGGARLLRYARLGTLQVNLTLSATQSPALLLKKFVQDAGACLSTVTVLELRYVDTSGSSVTAAVLGDAFALLAAACPSIKHLSTRGRLPITFLRTLGETCPSLTCLTLNHNEKDPLYLQRVLLLQPTLLPHISSLSLPCLQGVLPDLSQNTGIFSLTMPTFSIGSTHWLSLPRKLQHLKCRGMNGVPPVCDDSRDLLSSLLSIDVDFIKVSLVALSKVLREGPFPTQIKKCSFIINCVVDISTAADLLLVHQEMQMSGVERFFYDIRFSVNKVLSWSPQFISTLPRMTGVTSCRINCQHINLLAVLSAFRDVHKISISNCDALSNLKLHALTACTQLKGLELASCNSVTPMGLLALCQHLPGLLSVELTDCAALDPDEVDVCMLLLNQYGSQVVIVQQDPGLIGLEEIWD